VTARLRSEDGMGLVEVCIGMVLAIGIAMAIHSTLSKGLLNSAGHQRQVSATAIAENEIESIRRTIAQYGFDALALSAGPAAPTSVTRPNNPTDPNDWITGHGTAAMRFVIPNSFHDWSRGAVAAAPTGEPMLVNGATGRVSPAATLTTANGTARVYRYVTQRTETGCITAGTCDGDSRRVVVAVVLDAPGKGAGSAGARELQPAKPIYFQTTINAPVPKNQPGGGDGLTIGVSLP
jgi:hypothetical protein